MKQEFGTKQVEGRPFLGVRTSTTTDNIGEVMGPLFGEVYAHIQQSGQQAGRHAVCDVPLYGQ